MMRQSPTAKAIAELAEGWELIDCEVTDDDVQGLLDAVRSHLDLRAEDVAQWWPEAELALGRRLAAIESETTARVEYSGILDQVLMYERRRYGA